MWERLEIVANFKEEEFSPGPGIEL